MYCLIASSSSLSESSSSSHELAEEAVAASALSHMPVSAGEGSSVAFHADRNDFSTWLLARTESDVAKALKPIKPDEFETQSDMRDYLLSAIRAHRSRSRAGLVEEFSSETFEPESTFSKIGSGSVVIKDVPAHATVVGIPGRVVRINGKRCTPDTLLDHNKLPDPIAQVVDDLNSRIRALEEKLAEVGAQYSLLSVPGNLDRTEENDK